MRVSRVDLPDSVLTHKDGGVRVVEQVPGQVWELCVAISCARRWRWSG